MGRDRAMNCWDKMILPATRVWIGISARLSLRKTGLRKLREEVSTCEYEDIQVMWEMLRRTDTEVSQSPPANRRQLRKRRRRWIVLDWASYNLCSNF
ncbi:hypothetical protein HPP92_026436 [Vanilla planifolia]|uniref:Uncharacterized protein n=1 Tax=Vanilla planifolia TaxID=51239 RepID=A0A835U7T0_VANPL|nr:hypothetical protein HPP92_026436 [Vanilla planifolia]KAG0473856.1 hypothetical protein HPP92_015713 [Vanilla planifolia]